ncbi:MAG: MAPEG family protein [Oleiphilaceae bacterium]|nr:MAPEG family protein [Oleiphilaceae bacterium]
MEQTQIIYPAIAMFFLSMGMLLLLGFSRFFAIRRREVSVKYYRLYNEGSQPERLHLLARHVQNHFEVPPLFYAAVIFTYVTGTVNAFAVLMAWAFVALRVVHSAVHLGGNNVSVRFFTFGAGLLALTALWINLLLGLLA